MASALGGLVLAVALWPSGAAAEWTEWLIDADLTTRYESNLNRASVSAEEEWDVHFRPRLRVGRAYQLGDRTRVLARARLAGRLHARFDELHAVEAGAEVALFHKLGLGRAPWIRAFASGGYEGVRASQRSAPELEVGLAAGRRLSARIDARVSYVFTRRFGRSGPAVVPGLPDDVFDQRAHALGLEASLLLTDRLLLRAGFTWRRGDFDSNAQGSRREILREASVEAVARDTVFGGWVYRIDGDGYAPFVALSWGLSRRWSLDLDYRFQYGDGGGLEYQSHAATAAVLFRY